MRGSSGSGRRARLVGFSTHYNVSIDSRRRTSRSPSKLDALARLLTYVLPAPVMLLATNRESTGVGVRPRGDRIEMTADFTPDPTLMVAAGSLITGIIREMATWPSFDLAALRRRGLPRMRGFAPMPHTSRKGWLARFDCYPSNPFTSDAERAAADRVADLQLFPPADRARRRSVFAATDRRRCSAAARRRIWISTSARPSTKMWGGRAGGSRSIQTCCSSDRASSRS